MGFFDTIEKLQTAGPERRLLETISDPSGQEVFTVRRPEPEANKKAAGMPEELFFLPPCQACGGRVFVFTDSGSLSCSACWPEATGQTVKSTGPDQPQPDPDLQVDAEYSTTPTPMGDSFSPAHQGQLGSARAEILSFLRPCPLCDGRNFVLGSHGGFFCTGCQPGIPGQPIEAAGPDREKIDLNLDFQAAGGPGSSPGRSDSHQITDQERENFKAAWPWIKERLPDLLTAGWSRAALLRRGKHRHPSGNWGVAWLSVWKQPSLTVMIAHNGSIVFLFLSNGRTTRQTSHPINCNILNNNNII